MQCKGLFGGPIFVVGVQDIEVSQHEGVNASSFFQDFYLRPLTWLLGWLRIKLLFGHFFITWSWGTYYRLVFIHFLLSIVMILLMGCFAWSFFRFWVYVEQQVTTNLVFGIIQRIILIEIYFLVMSAWKIQIIKYCFLKYGFFKKLFL